MNFVLPGMGANNGMFKGPWRNLEDTVFLDWPKSSKAQSIHDLAIEFIQKSDISKGDSVIGTSLGGIVASEISNHLALDHLILIGSATAKEEISGLLRILSPWIDMAPLSFLQQSAGVIPLELSSMFATSDIQFMRRMCKAIFRWNGHHSGVRPFRIHGLKDSVIPLAQTVDVVIDGGNLIAMTHADDCVRAIQCL